MRSESAAGLVADPIEKPVAPSPMVHASQQMRDILSLVARVATGDAKVLITGESGVGKDLIAREIHGRSARASRSFIAVNCAGLTETLLESELFGHVKGSFTGAYRDKPGKLQLAHRGTLFLDEVGEMSLRMQALLLRFLENGEIQAVGADHIKSTVDVRVVAATNRNLGDMVANGQFREDLLYRLRVIHIHVPPLRERKEDVRVLVQHLAVEERRTHGGVLRRGAADARAVSLAGQRPRVAERRRAGAVDVQRQRGGSGAPAGCGADGRGHGAAREGAPQAGGRRAVRRAGQRRLQLLGARPSAVPAARRHAARHARAGASRA